MAFKLLVIGNEDSQVVRYLEERFEDLPYLINKMSISELLDAGLEAICEGIQPSIVINLYRWGAEFDSRKEQLCCEKIIEICRPNSIPIIHLSSFRVFGESESVEMNESIDLDSLSSVDVRYMDMESTIAKALNYLIVRIGWIIDEREIGLLDQILPKLLNGDTPLVASANHSGNPVFARSIADLVIALIQQILCGSRNWGVFHFRSSDSCSEAEFVDHLTRMLQAEFSLNPSMPEMATVEDLRRLMSGNALFSGKRLNENFGIQFISWRNGLKGAVRKWLSSNNHLKD